MKYATMRQSAKFQDLLQLLDKKRFKNLSDKWNIDKGVRSFSTWRQVRLLIIAVVLKLETLREIEDTLSVPRSTLSDANCNRCSGFYQDLCKEVLLDIYLNAKGRKHKRALKNLLALDSSECDVHGSLFSIPSWNKRNSKSKKASLKFHVIWNINGEWIEDFRITGSRRADSPVGKQFILESNSYYIFDRAYNDLSFWLKITKESSHFVSRLKKCPSINLRRDIRVGQNKNKNGVLWDGWWKPTRETLKKHSAVPKDISFRHIIYRDAETTKVFDFITSDLESPAQEIAAFYKKRW
jgi:hypothetical protein